MSPEFVLTCEALFHVSEILALETAMTIDLHEYLMIYSGTLENSSPKYKVLLYVGRENGTVMKSGLDFGV